MPVRRQEMDITTLFACSLYRFSQLTERCTVAYTTLGSQISHRRYESCPDDILNVYVIAKQPFLTAVGINHYGQ